MWNIKPSNLWDWNSLKTKIAQHGLRNSLVTVTSNTEIESAIFGNVNSIEPLDTNIKRRYISLGESKPKEIQVVVNVFKIFIYFFLKCLFFFLRLLIHTY